MSRSALNSVNSLGFFAKTVRLPHLVTPDEGREASATASWETNRGEWGMLRAFWPVESVH